MWAFRQSRLSAYGRTNHANSQVGCGPFFVHSQWPVTDAIDDLAAHHQLSPEWMANAGANSRSVIGAFSCIGRHMVEITAWGITLLWMSVRQSNRCFIYRRLDRGRATSAFGLVFISVQLLYCGDDSDDYCRCHSERDNRPPIRDKVEPEVSNIAIRRIVCFEELGWVKETFFGTSRRLWGTSRWTRAWPRFPA